MKNHDNPNHPLNGAEYHTGKPCCEPGCNEPAGTGWSPWWCQKCNAERMNRISAQLNRLIEEMPGKVEP